jgi:hypothetical protein
MPVTGLPLTFTHVITNDGAAVMTTLPLTDTYDPTFLEFSYAFPTPTIVTTGTLVWTDLTTFFGDLAPFQSIVVTTVFTATTQVASTVNQASTEGAIDVYDNDLTAGMDWVPITIIDSGPTATPTAAPTSTPAPAPTATPRPANTPVPAQPTAAPTQTAAPTATAVAVLMPQTGRISAAWMFVLLVALLAMGTGVMVLSRVRSK